MLGKFPARILVLVGTVLFVLHTITEGSAEVETTTTTMTTTTKSLEADFEELTKYLIAKFMPRMSDLIGRRDVSIACSASVVKLFLGLRNKDPWAIKNGTALGTLMYFSAVSNTRYLLRTENTDQNRPLLFLGGLKVLLIMWVIYGHAYFMVQMDFSCEGMGRPRVVRTPSEEAAHLEATRAGDREQKRVQRATTDKVATENAAQRRQWAQTIESAQRNRAKRVRFDLLHAWLSAKAVQAEPSHRLPYRLLQAVHQVMQATQWLLSIGLSCFVMFVTVPWNQGNPPSDEVNALYGGFHRVLWALALAWPSFACATGRGGKGRVHMQEPVVFSE
ncbi:hypothetical protein HPB48_020475 [Haemaphysalis longicornis]|uniref:Uncharacterized protein n=1 Tax=Haemaphysalis longicornis TaxID=44386 RepID=A0A9J6FEU7_HAELO|nr:hypothetical protein HPB48_020475 [Haemaphysalis longicornis]